MTASSRPPGTWLMCTDINCLEGRPAAPSVSRQLRLPSETMASSLLLKELEDIQAWMRAPGAGSPRIRAGGSPGLPLSTAVAAAAASSSDDEVLPLPPAPASPSKHTRELERQAAALRQQLAEANDRCRVLDGALQAARHDASLAVSKLHTQLATKADEASRLGGEGRGGLCHSSGLFVLAACRPCQQAEL